MNAALLNQDVQHYINDHLEEDLNKLVFKSSPFPEISMQEIVAQISAKKTAAKKLPTYFKTTGIFYPPKKNLEQASSQVTALFKADLMQGERAADLTGGYGIDSFFISKNFKTLDYFELNSKLSQIAKHNFKQLNVEHIRVNNTDGLTAITDQHYNWIYCDPDRRSSGKKAFKLQDCTPDLTMALQNIMACCTNLLVKTSPILDVSQTIKDLPGVSAVYALAVQGELKELLFVISKKAPATIKLHAVDCTATKIWTLGCDLNTQPQANYSMPQDYLYIPNAAIMKLQLFGTVGSTYGLDKLHEHSHFYTSSKKMAFPGRAFTINKALPYNKASMQEFKGLGFLVISRNFPLTVAQLRKRWKLADKGSSYLIFTTLMDGQKAILKCELI